MKFCTTRKHKIASTGIGILAVVAVAASNCASGGAYRACAPATVVHTLHTRSCHLLLCQTAVLLADQNHVISTFGNVQRRSSVEEITRTYARHFMAVKLDLQRVAEFAGTRRRQCAGSTSSQGAGFSLLLSFKGNIYLMFACRAFFHRYLSWAWDWGWW
jgi:hypothetical protein